jgi:hypothetical protein
MATNDNAEQRKARARAAAKKVAQPKEKQQEAKPKATTQQATTSQPRPQAQPQQRTRAVPRPAPQATAKARPAYDDPDIKSGGSFGASSSRPAATQPRRVPSPAAQVNVTQTVNRINSQARQPATSAREEQANALAEAAARRFNLTGAKPVNRSPYRQTNPYYDKAQEVLGEIRPAQYNFVRGLSSMASSALQGAAVQADKVADYASTVFARGGARQREETRPQDSRLYKAGEAINRRVDRLESYYGADKTRGSFVKETVPQALGSVAGFALAGMAGGGAAAATLGYSSGSGSAYAEAKEKGADDRTAGRAAEWNGLLGLTDAIPVSRVMSRAVRFVPPGVRRAVSSRAASALQSGATRAARDVAAGALEEGAQEAAQQIGGNLVARTHYDEKRGLLEGVGENAAAGGVTGALLASVATLAGAGRGFRTRRSQLDDGAEAEVIDAPDDPDTDGAQVLRSAEEVREAIRRFTGYRGAIPAEQVRRAPPAPGTRTIPITSGGEVIGTIQAPPPPATIGGKRAVYPRIERERQAQQQTPPKIVQRPAGIPRRPSGPTANDIAGGQAPWLQGQDIEAETREPTRPRPRPRALPAPASRPLLPPPAEQKLLPPPSAIRRRSTMAEGDIPDQRQGWKPRTLVLFTKADPSGNPDLDTLHTLDGTPVGPDELRQITKGYYTHIVPLDQETRRLAMEDTVEAVNQTLDEIGTRQPKRDSMGPYIRQLEQGLKVGHPAHKAAWLKQPAQQELMASLGVDGAQLIQQQEGFKDRAAPTGLWPTELRDAWARHLENKYEQRGLAVPEVSEPEIEGDLRAAQAILDNMAQGKYSAARARQLIGQDILGLAHVVREASGGRWQLRLRMAYGSSPRAFVERVPVGRRDSTTRQIASSPLLNEIRRRREALPTTPMPAPQDTQNAISDDPQGHEVTLPEPTPMLSGLSAPIILDQATQATEPEAEARLVLDVVDSGGEVVLSAASPPAPLPAPSRDSTAPAPAAIEQPSQRIYYDASYASDERGFYRQIILDHDPHASFKGVDVETGHEVAILRLHGRFLVAGLDSEYRPWSEEVPLLTRYQAYAPLLWGESMKTADQYKPQGTLEESPASPNPGPDAAPNIGLAPDVTTEATGADPNKPYQFRLKVVSLDDLVASHGDNLAPNPAFPQELQPRDRGRAGSQMQIDRIAQTLAPDALLVDVRQLDRGPMIVGPDGIVESGNGRTLALRQARANNPQGWASYQARLQEVAREQGIPIPAGIKDPVLVRERLTPVDRAAFAAEANESAVLAMSPFEQALQDSRRISNDALANLQVGESQSIDQALLSPANRFLVQQFVQSFPANERAGLLSSGAQLNRAGLTRLRAALFAHTYPGEAGARLTQTFADSLDGGVKNIENAMFASLPQMARAEGLARSGLRAADLAMAEDIAKAVDMLARLREQGTPVSEYLRQGSLFERELTPFQEQLLQHLSEASRSPKRLRELLAGYAEAVEAQPPANQMSMFDDMGAPNKEEIFNGIINQQKRADADAAPLFAALTDQPGPAEPGATAPASAAPDTQGAGLADATPAVTPPRREAANVATQLAALMGSGGAGVLLGVLGAGYYNSDDDERDELLRFDQRTKQWQGWLADKTREGVRQLPQELQKPAWQLALDAISQPAHWAQAGAGLALAHLPEPILQHLHNPDGLGQQGMWAPNSGNVSPLEQRTATHWLASMAGANDAPPEAQRAFFETMRIAWSGPAAQRRAFDELLQLGPNATAEQITEVLKRHESPLSSFFGEVLFDPLSLIKPVKLLTGGNSLQDLRVIRRAQEAMALASSRGSDQAWRIIRSFGDRWRLPETRTALAVQQASMRLWAQVADARDAMDVLVKAEDFLRRPTLAGEGVQFLGPIRADLDKHMARLVKQVKASPTPMDATTAARLVTSLVQDSVKRAAEETYGKTGGVMGAVVKVGQLQRRALGYLLLKVNPGFHVTNRIGNKGTQFIDGVFSLESADKMDNWWRKTVGVVPEFSKYGSDILGVSDKGTMLGAEALNSYQIYTAQFQHWFPGLWRMGIREAMERGATHTGMSADQMARLSSRLTDVWREDQVVREVRQFLVDEGPESGLDPRKIMAWAPNALGGQMRRARVGAIAAADQARNFTLLNYADRTSIDAMLDLAFPFHYWGTRSVFNWTQRLIDNPKVLAFYAQQQRYMMEGWNADQDAQGRRTPASDPDYLRTSPGVRVGTVRPFIKAMPFIPDDFLTSSMQDKDRLYLNFMQKLLPVEAVFAFVPGASYEPRLDDEKSDNLVNQVLTTMEKYPAGASPFLVPLLALMDKPLNLGLDQERFEIGAPVSIARPLRGATALYRDATGDTRIPAGGFDINAPVRQAFGYRARPAYEDKRAVRFLADSVRRGEITREEAVQAIRNQQGPIWEKAVQQTGRLYGDRALLSYGSSVLARGEPHQELGRINEARQPVEKALEAQYGENSPEVWAYRDEYPAGHIAGLSYQSPAEAQEKATQWVARNVGSRYARDEAGASNPQVERAMQAIREKTATPQQYELVADAVTAAAADPRDRQRQAAEQGIDADVKTKYPNFEAEQRAYFALPEGEARKAYLAKHPTLKQAWDYRSQRRDQSGLFPQTQAQQAREVRDNPPSAKALDYAAKLGLTESQARGMSSHQLGEWIDQHQAQAARAAGTPLSTIESILEKRKSRGKGSLSDGENAILRRYWDALYADDGGGSKGGGQPSQKQVEYAQRIGIATTGKSGQEISAAIEDRQRAAAAAAGATIEAIERLEERKKAGERLPNNEYATLKKYWNKLYGSSGSSTSRPDYNNLSREERKQRAKQIKPRR